MSGVEQLITQLEGAAHGSRELDAELYCAACACSLSHWVEDNAPDYTTSLDAALTLVPVGWGWGITSHGSAICSWFHGEPLAVEGKAATAALALCAAALKARAAQVAP